MNNTLYIRRNLSSVMSPYTGKRALWVDKNNVPNVDNVSWLISDYTLECNRYRWQQMKKQGQKRACLWIVSTDANIKVIDGAELNQCLNRFIRIDFPNPLDFATYDELFDELFSIEHYFTKILLHTDGNVYGLHRV